ncbi:Uncharacterised protein [Shigella flexneri]|nr:Uncharacterised protein [Shigella flexneri]
MRDLLQFVVIRHGFLYGLSVGDAIVRRPWKNLNAVDFVTDSYSRRCGRVYRQSLPHLSTRKHRSRRSNARQRLKGPV